MSRQFQTEKKSPQTQIAAGLLQQRATNANEHEPETVPPIVYEVLRSPGQPLDEETRAFFEPRFGHDFSQLAIFPVPNNTTDTCPLKATPTRCPFGGDCHTCPPRLQTKLVISQPGDEYEQEADRIAEQVMRMAEPKEEDKEQCHFLGCTQALQRQTANAVTPSEMPPIVHEVLSSSGQPLDDATRSFMEPRLHHDFSQVRVHTDNKASESASAINALAYTFGQHVAFAVGHYAPGNSAGRQVLAHELAHVIQGDATASSATGPAHPSLRGSYGQPPAVLLRKSTQGVCVDRPRYENIKCVRESTGYPGEPGVPTENAIAVANRECKQKTGYNGTDITLQECESVPFTIPSVSAEIEDAPVASEARTRVECWLMQHAEEIVAQEQAFAVDRRAIAGAIAWEALENPPLPVIGFIGRGAKAPAKPHLRQHLWSFAEGVPLVKQVEEAGYLPYRMRSERGTYIESSPSHAIEYIAASMSGLADVAERYGYTIRYNPVILVNFYQGSDLTTCEQHFAKKREKGETTLTAGNTMALWLQRKENLSLVEEAVGKPHLGSAPPIAAVPAVRSRRLRELLEQITAETTRSLTLQSQLDLLPRASGVGREKLDLELANSRTELIRLLEQRMRLLEIEVKSLGEKISATAASSPELTSVLMTRENEVRQHEQQLRPLLHWQTRRELVSIRSQIEEVNQQIAVVPPMDPNAPTSDTNDSSVRNLMEERMRLEKRREKLAKESMQICVPEEQAETLVLGEEVCIDLLWPVDVSGSQVWSCYGRRQNPFNPEVMEGHPGIDITQQQGTPVYAAASGTVILSGDGGGYGSNFVAIRHSSALITSYGHMDSSLVRQGAVVRRGEQLGTVGSQGMSTGPHLHFNVIAGRKPADIYNGNVDPLKNGLRIPAGVENRAQCG